MTNRELIKQLLDEDLDAEVVIEATTKGGTFSPPDVQGINIYQSSGARIVLVPEGRLVVE